MSWSRDEAYAQDPRERVFACVDTGQSVSVLAPTLLVSVPSVRKMLSRRRATGEARARPTLLPDRAPARAARCSDPRVCRSQPRHDTGGTTDLGARGASALRQLDRAIHDTSWHRPDAKKDHHEAKQNRDDVAQASERRITDQIRIPSSIHLNSNALPPVRRP